jgi:hypothetical protein
MKIVPASTETQVRALLAPSQIRSAAEISQAHPSAKVQVASGYRRMVEVPGHLLREMAKG